MFIKLFQNEIVWIYLLRRLEALGLNDSGLEPRPDCYGRGVIGNFTMALFQGPITTEMKPIY